MTERLITEWSNKPYTSHRKRHITVNHRIVINWYPDVGCDVRHEIKCDRRDIDEWTLAEKWECRAHGVEKMTTKIGEGLP